MPQEQPLLMSLVGLVWYALQYYKLLLRSNKPGRAVGTVLGPVVGGAFANSAATWRWVR